MSTGALSEKDGKMAKRFAECPVCTRARKKQQGIAHGFVKHVEEGLCP